MILLEITKSQILNKNVSHVFSLFLLLFSSFSMYPTIYFQTPATPPPPPLYLLFSLFKLYSTLVLLHPPVVSFNSLFISFLCIRALVSFYYHLLVCKILIVGCMIKIAFCLHLRFHFAFSQIDKPKN